jgi:phosphatidylserine decarboxylase
MKIHKEGHKIALYIVFLLVLLNLILYRIAGSSLFFYFIFLSSIGAFFMILNFFRSPHRVFKDDEPGSVVAPADGTIVVIEEVMENEYFFDKRIQVSIFMSLFNAHVNWVPCDGKVIKYSHQNGRFMAAYLPKSSTDNERSTIVIERENGEQILVRQIAGAMAKRIVTYTKTGQDCRINQQLGFIKFGSRVDLFLPLNTEIMVKPDECVRGNLTTIAKLKT